ncbi:MAG: maleylpyruvate isomerase family mycothiol-dependent enzyme [Mycobacteriales bacterium]
MTEVADRYARVADRFTAVLRGCPSGGWNHPSPCPDWTAHGVAQHVVDTHRRVLTRLTGGDPTPPDTDADLSASWQVESSAIRSILGDAERAATPVQSMTGQQPFEQVVGTLLCADTLIHTWDLARATGQDERLDTGAVTSALEFLQPNDDMLRAPGGMGPKVEPPAGADEQTRLLCFVGRRP